VELAEGAPELIGGVLEEIGEEGGGEEVGDLANMARISCAGIGAVFERGEEERPRDPRREEVGETEEEPFGEVALLGGEEEGNEDKEEEEGGGGGVDEGKEREEVSKEEEEEEEEEEDEGGAEDRYSAKGFFRPRR
jgi:hypothetical protein